MTGAMVAALYVERDGIYSAMPGVELWGIERDARTYSGPWPVVAHPPCAAWSQLAGLRQAVHGYPKGEDGGTFAAALAAVEQFGGVLEHPAESAAWAAHGMAGPARGVWLRCRAGWTTEVSQVAYGHRARKRTWLYLVGEPSRLDWTEPAATHRCSEARGAERHPVERMSRRERRATPPAFARELLALVRGELQPGGEQLTMFDVAPLCSDCGVHELEPWELGCGTCEPCRDVERSRPTAPPYRLNLAPTHPGIPDSRQGELQLEIFA